MTTKPTRAELLQLLTTIVDNKVKGRDYDTGLFDEARDTLGRAGVPGYRAKDKIDTPTGPIYRPSRYL